MHMTCSQCRHEFCWLCQGPWAEHGERTGGFYNCNRCGGREGGGWWVGILSAWQILSICPSIASPTCYLLMHLSYSTGRTFFI
jgi:hypothetical protein